DGVVDSRGDGLSGGQAQRVAAARAVYRARRLDCALVAFDEPSSALDAETEAALARGLRALADEGRAVLVVTHRPALVAAADAVLDLEALAAAGALAVRAAADGLDVRAASGAVDVPAPATAQRSARDVRR
ncbi:MAG: hypothetical protein Q7T55_02110, partial [Solirubrobacteraceae bacterium]|nr:hypothetical protein [Solirubrobacteraceae bacterium]